MERGKLLEKRRMGLTAWNTGDIVKRQTVSKDGGLGVRTVGHIDMEKFRCITDEITTDEVVITEERIQHIKERHPGHFEKIFPFFQEALCSPDYILEDKNLHTALILKKIEKAGISFQVVLRLHTSTDAKGFKNSIISAWEISKSRWDNYINNANVKKNLDSVRDRKTSVRIKGCRCGRRHIICTYHAPPSPVKHRKNNFPIFIWFFISENRKIFFAFRSLLSLHV